MAYQHTAYYLGHDFYPYLTWSDTRLDIFYGFVMVTLSLYLAQGFFLTRSREDYFFRLFLLAIISQFPFSVFHPYMLNVVFTYLLGFMAIYAFEYKMFYTAFLVLCSSYIFYSALDWGCIAVFMIFVFYLLLKGSYYKKVTYDFLRLPKVTYYYFYPIHYALLVLIFFYTT